MAYNTVPTVATGDLWTAANQNTYVKDNLAALWPYTAAGQIAYATAATTLAALAAPTADKVLGESAGLPSWIDYVSGISLDYFNDANTHTYGTAVWRDMPNSSKVVTLAKTSTILCIGHLYEYGTTGKTYAFFEAKFNIDGTDIDFGLAKRNYGISEKDSVPIFGYKTGVAAGNRTIKIRELCNADGYTIDGKTFVVFIIPE